MKKTFKNLNSQISLTCLHDTYLSYETAWVIIMERECLVTVGDQGFVYSYASEDTDANVI